MHFTREPIIETIITPKEGYKLSIKSSKGETPEEYLVDAVEVVSFGQTFFYRSLERPKSFLLPVSDYEITETRELRLVVKNLNIDKSIKIAGGKESSAASAKSTTKSPVSGETDVAKSSSPKRERKRQRRTRRPETTAMGESSSNISDLPQEAETEERIVKSGSLLSSLLTPPPTLISETLSQSTIEMFSNKHPIAKEKSIQEELPPSVSNLEEPISTEPLSGTTVHQQEFPSMPHEHIDPPEDTGLVSEEPRQGETLEERGETSDIFEQ